MVCTFTGHRPEQLPWGSEERDPRCLALKELIARAVEHAAESGYGRFLCGMARGCDTYFAEAVLALRERRPELQLTAMIPCPSQPESWPEEDQARYAALLERCSGVCVLEPMYSSGCMLRRNRAMVDAASLLITVYDGSPQGGTAATVRYARQRGVRLLPLWV